MPAIQPARLKIQAAQLAERFYDPSAFARGLHDLLDFYADRTHRAGQTGEPPPLLPSYNVPAPVLRQVTRELSPLAAADQSAALALCDALWEKPNYEFRVLAAGLLGQISPHPPEPILERLQSWIKPSTEVRLVNLLVNSSLAGVRRDLPDRYLKQIEAWLFAADTFSKHIGLQAILPLLEPPVFKDLPRLFHMVTELVRAAPSALRADLLDVIQRLAAVSPKETAYFLRQNLAIKADNPGTAWLTRNSLPYFPPDIQANLRSALREGK